jgi:hypothetical protein
MPNWCDNTLELTHENPEMMDKAIEGWKTGKFFATLHPEPDFTKVKVKPTFDFSGMSGKPQPEFVDPEQAWYDWRLQNWGTKWEITTDESYIDIQDNEHGKSIRASFSTAWSPPTELYHKLVADGYQVKALYYEGGCAFCGIYEDGNDETYGIDGKWKDVKENIPPEIDAEFSITESMKEWKAEELAEEIEELVSNLSDDKDNHELIAELIAKKQELKDMEDA